MTVWSTLIIGLGLGLRHATDPDHIAAVSTLVHRERHLGRAARIAALWGAGHTMTFLTLGLAIVLAGVRLPDAFEHSIEIILGVMLIALGAWTLLRTPPSAPGARATGARPVLIGIVHGLGGSAGIALLAATTLGSRATAAAYLVVVALGTMVGMVILTVLMCQSLSWALERSWKLQRSIVLAASLASMGMGVFVLAKALG